MDKQATNERFEYKAPERSKDGMCYLCGLRTPDEHEDPLYCIEELRTAMLRQRESAQHLGLDISTRFLAVLEELAAHPENGLSGYVVHNPHTGNKEQLPPQRVAGVIANIRHSYEKLGDWSPVRALRDELKETKQLLRKMALLLEECLPHLPEDRARRALLLMERDTPDTDLPGPGRS